MGDIAHRIAVLGSKGGVGKSTVAANVAYELSLQGYRVGVLDADMFSGAVGRMLGVTGLCPQLREKKLFPVEVSPCLKVMSMSMISKDSSMPPFPTKGALERYVRSIEWGALDILLIDPPPGPTPMMDEVLGLANASSCIIVTTPQSLALENAERIVRYAQDEGFAVIGVIENMATYDCGKCRHRADILDRRGVREMAVRAGVPFLGAIPFSEQVAHAGDIGRPLSAFPSDFSLSKVFCDIASFVRIFLYGN